MSEKTKYIKCRIGCEDEKLYSLDEWSHHVLVDHAPPPRPQSPADQFFTHLLKGEVMLFPENVIQITTSGGNMIERGFRVVIQPKEAGE